MPVIPMNIILQICHKIMNATFAIADSVKGKRYATPICAACCGEDYCNQYACETIKRKLYTYCLTYCGEL